MTYLRLPHEYWVIYQICCGDSDAAIKGSSELYDIRPPEDGYLHVLRAKTPQPIAKTPVGVRMWQRRMRVHSMCSHLDAANEARECLLEPRLRPLLEILLLADTPREDIPKYCKDITGLKPSVKAVKLFEHYFWNRSLLSDKQWGLFLNKDREDKEKWHLHDCYMQGPEYALWRMGYRIEVDHQHMLELVAQEACMRIMQSTVDPNTRDTAIKANLWLDGYMKVLERLDREGHAKQEVLDLLRSMSIRLDKSTVEDIESVTGGSYSSMNATGDL
jgi:hypothetical protein